MYYFSEEFLTGLRTKSENFQNKFYEIIDDICKYFDTEEEKEEFQKYIEENHSYDKPGNVLFSTWQQICGNCTAEELREKINFFLLGLFDGFESADAITTVPHIIVCISAPEGYFSEEDTKFLRNLLSFERLCRKCPPVTVTTILNDDTENRGTSCCVVALK